MKLFGFRVFGGLGPSAGAILGALAGATAGRSSLPDAWCKGHLAPDGLLRLTRRFMVLMNQFELHF